MIQECKLWHYDNPLVALRDIIWKNLRYRLDFLKLVGKMNYVPQMMGLKNDESHGRKTCRQF